MKTIYKIIGLFVLLHFLAGCNDSDDVAAIFTGRVWKLTMISRDGEGKMCDFWGGDDAKRKESIRKLQSGGTFTISFDGSVEGDRIQGAASGTTITQPLSGQWSADGKSREFRAGIAGNDEGDALARNFLEGVNSATQYDGDSRNLYLIYEKQGIRYRMFFREYPTNKK